MSWVGKREGETVFGLDSVFDLVVLDSVFDSVFDLAVVLDSVFDMLSSYSSATL